jgi:YidC/Oxa1 family membrane protein insertase
MEKRALIAIVLSVAVLLVFTQLFPSPAPQPAKKVVTAAPAGEAGEAGKGKAAAPAEQATVPAAGQAEALAPEAVPGTPLKPEKDITVDTSLYTAVISTNGGVIKSWKLKDYKDESGKAEEMVTTPAGVKPLAVVPEGMSWQAAEKLPYDADRDSLNLSGSEDGTLNLSYTSPDGERILKKLKFKGGTYNVAGEVDVQGIKGYTLYGGDGFGSLTSPLAKKGYGYVGPLTIVDGEKHKDEPAKLTEKKQYKGAHGWTGITDKYFIAALVPRDGLKAVVAKGVSDWGSVGLAVPYDGGLPKEDFLLYAGPKEYERLKDIGSGLDRAVDFGWFTFIAKPLFVSLRFFYELVGNWGWAIIIITVIIKLLFAPLTHKSQKSMKKMQKLQPLFGELKEKYKGDPQRLNREMMELYKKHKVNPMGGCLPMAIQIPVFIALYNVLNNAIELRRAPFALWLTDLSAKDPYYVLPILMGLSMLVMQKMTPTSMDPKQNKIMMIMPVVLTFMFINLPSGLVLYFTISNLLSMAQQFYINKYSKD